MKKVTFIVAFLLACAQLHAANTPRAGINLIPDGALNWGFQIRDNYQIIDSSFAVQSSSNVFTSTNTFTQYVVLSYTTPGQCLIVAGDHGVVSMTCPGSGGASTLGVFVGGVSVSTPTGGLNFVSGQFRGNLVGANTAQIDLDPGTTYFVHNGSAPQAATENISSGTILAMTAGTLGVNQTLQVSGNGITGNGVIFQAAGSTFNVTAAGNVGIGTATPLHTLDVHGDAAFTGLVAGSTMSFSSATATSFTCTTCTINAVKWADGSISTTAATGGGGTITAVNAGFGLQGGGASGSVTLSATLPLTGGDTSYVQAGSSLQSVTFHTSSGTANSFTCTTCTIANETVQVSTINALSLNSGKIVNLANGASAADAVAYAQVLGFRVLQIVSSTTISSLSSTSGSFADTTLTATITPTLSTSKILVLVSQNCETAGGNGVSTLSLQLLRAGSIVFGPNAAGYESGVTTLDSFSQYPIIYLDSPATTSATIYKTQFARSAGTGTVVVNDSFNGVQSISTIILIEIG